MGELVTTSNNLHTTGILTYYFIQTMVFYVVRRSLECVFNGGNMDCS